MVRVISSNSIGYGDYVATYSDAEVDGVSYEEWRRNQEELNHPDIQIFRRPRVKTATPIKGGQIISS